MRRARRMVFLVVATSAMVIGGATSAAASAVYSIWGTYGPILGIPYANRSEMSNTYSPAESTTWVKSTNGATIPAGWSGAQASLYLNGGTCGHGAMVYEEVATSSPWGTSFDKWCGSGNYYARGSTAAYNGNGYSFYYTHESPILQLPQAIRQGTNMTNNNTGSTAWPLIVTSPVPTGPTQPLSSATAIVFPRNAQGQTYGSELDAATLSQAPDLILAWATNGREGYVKKTALYPPMPANPAAALALQGNGPQVYDVPVYLQDGTTVVGIFRVGG